MGQIEWWKTDPVDYDRPDLPHIGTMRTASQVLLILSLTSTAEEPAPSRSPATSANVELFLEGMRTALATVDSNDDIADLVAFLMEHGHRTPETETDGDAMMRSNRAGPMTSDESPGTLTEDIAEMQELRSWLDGVSWPAVDALSWVHGYDELQLPVECLLEELACEEQPDASSSRGLGRVWCAVVTSLYGIRTVGGWFIVGVAASLMIHAPFTITSAGQSE